jgi:nitroimidazol reductase NimA-like FMN-containing flavoprotein (pyridoxamine 5'-phosphate oxidase superfamily)
MVDVPESELNPTFSSEDASATSWAEARRRLEDADLAWLATVRPDGRPHVTPLVFLWLGEAAFFVTGPEERKAKNLEHNTHCILTTGSNVMGDGLDVVVEGDATSVTDPVRRRMVADAFATKYLPRDGAKVLHTDLRNGTFIADDGGNLLYEVAPTTVFGFGKGEFSQTRWRFPTSER